MNEGGNPKNIAAIYDEYDDATKGFVSVRGIIYQSLEDSPRLPIQLVRFY